MAIKSQLHITSPASFRVLEIFSVLIIESVIDFDSNLLKDVSSVSREMNFSFPFDK